MLKKILIFSLAYHPHVGGAEIAIKEITDRISPEEIEFHMVTLRFSPHDPKEEKIGNILVHRVGGGASYLSKILFIPRAAREAKEVYTKYQFDGMWAMMSYMLLPLLLSGIKLPYVLTLQEGDTYEHMFSRLRILPFLPLINRGFREATVVQVISKYLGQWARRRGYKGDVEVIPNGYDQAVWFSAIGDAVTDRQTYWKQYKKPHFDTGGTILITTSRLVWKNAVDDVIRAVKLLPSNVHLVIFGEGTEKARLERLTEGLEIIDRVHFCGQIKNTAVAYALKASDIFVRPSRSEGMGNSFIEAMAAGLPVIATQEGGIADFLFDATRNPDTPTTGWAVDKDSPEQIAAAVKEILARPSKAAQIVQNAQHMVREKYGWDKLAKQMRERVFGRVLLQ